MTQPATARVCGTGNVALIFVHGVGSTAAIWDYQLRRFSGSYRCLAVELRGNGVPKPEAAPETITREGFVDDVLAIADSAGADRFHFVGCSLGGVVGFELWKRAPRRMRSCVFAGSFAAYPNAAQYVENVIESVTAAGSMAAFAQERVRKLGMPAGFRTDETIAQMACKSVPSYIASTRATWTGDYRSLLSTISVPVLVVRGENDGVATAALAEEIARGIPSAQLETIPAAGHVVNADAPDAFNALLRSFLSVT